MRRLSFRARVFLYLVLFAAVPATVLMLGGAAAVGGVVPLLTGGAPWERAAESGMAAIAEVRGARLTPRQRAALVAHEQELAASLTQARRFSFLASRAGAALLGVAVLGSVLFVLLALRVAGHLSRQLGRPLQEMVRWTELIVRGESLPEGPLRRGTPEFETLRTGMRTMARELESARERELEAERLRAFRETARRVAHELKNPLTPIRFAVERLRRDAPPELADAVDVLATESGRLEDMARNFAQFGRLPEGPLADVDLGELARYAARATLSAGVPITVDVADGLPMVRGHHDALSRALANVLLNAVEACRDGGAVRVSVDGVRQNGHDAVAVAVRDTGCGIARAQLGRIWDPYVTTKGNGTGLGLAIARQTVRAHRGTVEASSVEGEGTEIRFVIPVADETSRREPAVSFDAATQGRPQSLEAHTWKS